MAEARRRRRPRLCPGSSRVTIQVAIVGIDGSGKSTLAASLAAVIAAERGLVAGFAVADELLIRPPDIYLAGPRFHPLGYTIAAPRNRFFRMVLPRGV